MKKSSILTSFALTALAMQAGAQVTIFSEAFDNITGNNAPLGDYSWAATFGASATAYNVSDSSNSGNADGADKPLVSGAASSEGAVNGYIFQNPFKNQTPLFIYTNGLSLGPDSGSGLLDTISFALRNTATDMDFRIAVEVGAGNWFIADETFNNATTNVWSDLQLDASTATWRNLTVNVGSEINIAGSTTALSSGSLTGFGFYTTTAGNGNYIRIDTLEVAAVPEPATYAALLGFLSLGVVIWRRR